MVDMERQLNETAAGQTLFHSMQKIVRKQRENLAIIRADAMRGNNNLGELGEQHEELQKQLAKALAEVERLKIPLGRRVRRIFDSPLGFMARR
jgi:t-SNARE complex subunit (syntaxin)